MRIAQVLRNKGAHVATIAPDASITELLDGLADQNIGAMVVLGESREVLGIVSERDIVRKLHEHGPEALRMSVSAIMTAIVATCDLDSSVDDLSELMTENRVRHIPVLEQDRLAGIVSIGDVVKIRMEELKTERQLLEAYITQG